MTNNKWYLMHRYNYGDASGVSSYDTKEELEKYLSSNRSDGDEFMIVYGKEYKHELIVRVVE